MTRHDSQERVARSWLKDWIIPAGAVLVTATGAWVRMEHVAGEHNRRLADVETRVSRLFDVGPDGFSDPFLHSAHDLHLRHEINGRFVTKQQWDEWRRVFHQLNPDLVKPRIEVETSAR